MQIGVHALVFSGKFDHSGVEKAVAGASEAGFDLLELPLMDPRGFDARHAAAVLTDAGIAATASLGLTETTDLTSEDPRIVAAGEDELQRSIDIVAAVGGDVLCGVIHSAMRKYLAPATARGIENSQAAISRLGEYAAARDVRLSLEVVNRYETNTFNTGKAALRFLDGVTADNVSVHLDSYHMNIEETDMFRPVHAVGDRLGYVHIGESHRGYLGTGSVDFDAFFRALDDTGYDGPVVFESFSSSVVSAELSNTLGIWRNLWEDSADLAAHANRFIRDGIHAVQTMRFH